MKIHWYEQDGGCRVTFYTYDGVMDEPIVSEDDVVMAYSFPDGVWEYFEKYFNAKILHRKPPENAFIEGETNWTEARGFE